MYIYVCIHMHISHLDIFSAIYGWYIQIRADTCRYMQICIQYILIHTSYMPISTYTIFQVTAHTDSAGVTAAGVLVRARRSRCASSGRNGPARRGRGLTGSHGEAAGDSTVRAARECTVRAARVVGPRAVRMSQQDQNATYPLVTGGAAGEYKLICKIICNQYVISCAYYRCRITWTICTLENMHNSKRICMHPAHDDRIPSPSWNIYFHEKKMRHAVLIDTYEITKLCIWLFLAEMAGQLAWSKHIRIWPDPNISEILSKSSAQPKIFFANMGSKDVFLMIGDKRILCTLHEHTCRLMMQLKLVQTCININFTYLLILLGIHAYTWIYTHNMQSFILHVFSLASFACMQNVCAVLLHWCCHV